MATTTLPTLSTRDAYKPRKPTALEVLREENINDWSDKVIMITGASSGIGIETARAFAHVGAHLILPVRNQEKAQAVVEDIKNSAKNTKNGAKSQITLLNLDLNSLQSVQQCASDFLKLNSPLHILICNAGIMATPEVQKTQEGYDAQFGTNHLAHFLLFELLKDKLLASSTNAFNSRVVVLSSNGHQFSDIQWDNINFEKPSSYDPWKAYGQSKTANILMARNIEQRYGAQGLHANAVHPGFILTDLGRHLSKEFTEHFLEIYKHSLKSLSEGAATTVCAACAKELEGKGGEYFENCSHTFCMDEAKDMDASAIVQEGYASHVYNEESAKRLYELSLKMVGLA